VTLFHVMAEPPAIYAHLLELEEDVTALLASGSELGRNLVAEKKALEKVGVVVNVRVRHGFIIDQLLDEIREGNYDLIVTGSSRARGPLQHYIMGDVTQRILDSAECSVLVARYRPPGPAKGLWQSLARLFR
jgi:nucleotide-binding universal stress UspA family protein